MFNILKTLFKSIRLSKPTVYDPDETVRYNITNSGNLEIDVERLVNSTGFKRQVAAARRLKGMQLSD